MPKPPLNAEQMAIIRDKQVKLNRPASELIALLAPLAKWDAGAGKTRARFGCGGAVFVAAAVGLFIAGIKTGAVACTVLGIVLIVVWARKRKEDISDNLRATAIPFLAALREDFGSDPVALTLDLRLPTSAEKKTDTRQEGSGLRKTSYTTYVDPWMSGEGTLTDGTRLEWTVVDTYVERKRWKKGASGKYKQKTKTKKKTDVDVTVTLKAKRYDVGAVDRAEVKRGENKNVVRVSQKVARVGADPVPADVILEVIAGVFRDLRPAQ